MDFQDQVGLLANLVQLGRRGQKVFQVMLDQVGHQVSLDQLDKLEPLEPLVHEEILVHQDHRVLRDQEEIQDHRAQLALEAIQELPDLQDNRETLEHQELLVPQGCLDQLDLQEI